MKLIGTSKHKIYTIPEGDYNGVWSGYRVHLYDETNIVFTHFDTNVGMKGNVRVKVKIGVKPHAQIYEDVRKVRKN